MLVKYKLFFVIYLCYLPICYTCNIPKKLIGRWYSRENNVDTITTIETTEMSGRGRCIAKKEEHHVNYTFVFEQDKCFTCVKITLRTINVIEKMESGCVNFPYEHVLPTVDEVCLALTEGYNSVTLFLQSYIPINCRSSLQGVYHFAYQNRFTVTGECNHPDALINSCQEPGTQFYISNQKFNITYRKCPGIAGTFDAVIEYSCLGDWFVGKNHFFAVAKTKESRNDEKFRCFMRNRDDDLYLAVSDTAQCNTLQGTENTPERLRITPIKKEQIAAGCKLPETFYGDWINTGNLDADVFINATAITETWYPDEGRWRQVVYVCKETRGSRFLMARLTADGCQKDFVCWDFVPRHHNLIRYRKGIPIIKENFSTVCSWVQFRNSDDWKYDLLLAKSPVPVRCPVAGKYRFTQAGESMFETRILGGVTESPRPDLYCKENISDFSVCDAEQKEIRIDENFCLSVDHLGRPIDIYSEPDYKMKCIGYWKENLKSYLITYDELDALSKYRCWVYQRADLTRVLMSLSVGPFCDIAQDVSSANQSEGAAVSLIMDEYEREKDQCPMYFDDGSNPYKQEALHIKLFRFNGSVSTTNYFKFVIFFNIFVISLFN